MAEDNPTNQIVAKTILMNLGYEIDIVENGLEALKALDNKDYDIILMDVQMPELDGMEATKRIRSKEKNQKHTIIIAMTAHVMQGDQELCLKIGMDDYIGKPIKKNALESLLNKYVLDMPKDFKKVNQNVSDMRQISFDKSFVSQTFGESIENQVEFIEKFIIEIKEQPALLKKAIDDNKLLDIAKISHRLKGATGDIGAKRLYDITIDLESAANNQDIEQCQKLWKYFVQEKNKLLNELQKEYNMT